MKTALVGMGNWGRKIIRNLDDISDVSICCHGGSDEGKEFLKEDYPEVVETSELDDVLKEDGIDAVFIATPPETHFDIAKKVVQSGKDVFVEKPMTTSEEKSEELMKIVEDSEHILFVGYIFLYHPVYAEISDIVDSEELNYLRCDWRKTGSFSDKLTSTLTCHDLAIANSFTGTEAHKFSVRDKVRNRDRMDILELDIDFRAFRFSGSYNRVYPGKEKSVILRTDENNLYIWKEDKLYAFDRDNQKFEEIFETEKEPLRLEIEAFLDCVENRKTPRTDASFGHEVDKLISEIEADI